MGIAELTRFCNICFVSLVIEICSFLICKSNGSCALNFYKENGTCIACPRGSFGYDCIRTCSSEYFGQNCNEKCNCSSNQRCDPVIGCLEKNVITERLSVQHLTETPNFTGRMIYIWYVIYALNLYNVYDCNQTCPSGYFGHKCNKRCQCSSNQGCDPVIGCLEINLSITTERLSIQYLTETHNVTGNFLKLYMVGIYIIYLFLLLSLDVFKIILNDISVKKCSSFI